MKIMAKPIILILGATGSIRTATLKYLSAECNSDVEIRACKFKYVFHFGPKVILNCDSCLEKLLLDLQNIPKLGFLGQ